MADMVAITGLVVRRGRSTVLDGAELVLEEGAFALLQGDNGAGKSTLIQAILGLLPLEHGSIHLGGELVRDGDGRRRRRPPVPLGVLLQTDGDVRDQTVRHHLETAAALGQCHATSEELEALLQASGLRHRMEDRMVELSEGQRRRVGLLGALLPGLVEGGGRLVVLDEPTAGLDEQGVEIVQSMVQEAVARGSTVLLGTHHPERFPTASHRLLVHDGKVTVDALAPAKNERADLPALAHSLRRPSPFTLGLRYAWSGGTPLSGAVPGVLMCLGLAALLLQPDLVDSLSGTTTAGLLLLPSLIAGLAGDASLLTLRRDRAYARLWALGCRPFDLLTPAMLGLAGVAGMAAVLGHELQLQWLAMGGLTAVTASMIVRAGDLLGLRLARPEALQLRLLLPILVLPFGLVLGMMA